ncbi:MAG: multiprotein-bridging factor 1 family protein [Solirubrobacterales bacterium]
MNEIKKRREQLGLSQAQLAAAIGVDQPTISRVEHGFRLADPDRQNALERLLNGVGD